MIIKTIENPETCGNVKMQGNVIVGFIEKPKQKKSFTYMVNAGAYILNKNMIPDDTSNYKIESDYYPEVVHSHIIKGYFHNGERAHLQDEETFKKYQDKK